MGVHPPPIGPLVARCGTQGVRRRRASGTGSHRGRRVGACAVAGDEGQTVLEWLKTPATRHSPSTLADTMAKVRILKQLGAHEWQLEGMPAARQGAYARPSPIAPRPNRGRRTLQGKARAPRPQHAGAPRFHQALDLDNPCNHPGVRELLHNVRRGHAERGVRTRKQAALTRAPLEAVLDTCDDTPRGIRDRALLLFAWASGGRRKSRHAHRRRDKADRTQEDRDVHELLPGRQCAQEQVGADARGRGK